MAGEYKAPCGCKIHVIQWTAKRKVVTQESCSLHKAAPKLLAAANEVLNDIELEGGPTSSSLNHLYQVSAY